jgi:hypothetical protein
VRPWRRQRELDHAQNFLNLQEVKTQTQKTGVEKNLLLMKNWCCARIGRFATGNQSLAPSTVVARDQFQNSEIQNVDSEKFKIKTNTTTTSR